jgi:hypothetical protein
MRENVITDRTIIDVMAFTHCAKSIDKIDKEEFIKYASMFIKEYDYVFYVSPIGVEIEDNGVRETNVQYRELIDMTIKHIAKDNLDNFKSFGIISGTTEQRIEQVKFYLGF